jgi:uncharacterized protein
MKWKAFLGGVVAVALASTSEPVVLETSSGKVAGTLLLPEGSGPHPVALIIAGSGPTDRDGNSVALPGKNDSLKKLAEELAASGIASLRYDKKGVGESTKVPEGDLRFDTYIDDAVEWCNRLRGDRRFSFLTIIGHSEGSLIGMAAAKKANADGFVSIAGAGRPAQDVIREQLKAAPPDLQNQANEILKSLSDGKTVEMIPAQLAALFRASVQPYLISWFRYDPAKQIAALEKPVLIEQGTTDIQVSVQDAKLLSQARPSAKLSLIEGMNHVLKQVPADRALQVKSYSDPALPVHPELVKDITAFVLGLRR